jgi:hypothetical protein
VANDWANYGVNVTMLRSSESERNALKEGDGDGTSGGVTEDWKADVERRLGQLHDDVRALLNRGVLAVIGLAGMIGGLYLYTNAKFDTLNARLGGIETQAATLNGKLDLLLERTAPKKTD